MSTVYTCVLRIVLILYVICWLFFVTFRYIQGVSWDPRGILVATCGSDRAVRVYRAGSRHTQHLISKFTLPGVARRARLFQDDSWKSFFRRLAFSPDGLLLVCPAGQIPPESLADGNNSFEPGSAGIAWQHAAHLLLTRSLGQGPVACVPTGRRPCIAVRFCPVAFELQLNAPEPAFLQLPYRWVYVMVLEDAILLCDTQRTRPIGFVSNIHYQALNDASWSSDGRLLCVCSTDGYCSFLSFDEDELGQRYMPSLVRPPAASKRVQQDTSATPKSSVMVTSVECITSNASSLKTPRRVSFVTLDSKYSSDREEIGDKRSLQRSSESVGGDEDSHQSPLKKKRRVNLITLSTNI